MKILITIYDGAISKNILRSRVLGRLREEPGAEIVIVVNPKKLDYYRASFGFPNVRFVTSPSVMTAADALLSIVILNSIPTRAMRIWQRGRYLSKDKRLFYGAGRILSRLGRFRGWRSLLRAVDALMPVPRVYSELLDAEKPDVIFLNTMMSPDDIAFARLAARRGIATVGMVKGWDNPTTKTFIRMIPDKIVVHNDIMKGEIERLYDVPVGRIAVTGIPQYDRWLDPGIVIPKDEFFRSLGLESTRKLILYAAAGDWMNKADEEIVRLLSAAIGDGRLAGAQVLVRLHPKYPSTAESLTGLPHVFIERPGTNVTGELMHWEYEESDLRHLVSTLKWSDVVVNTASTFTIDAAIVDRPIVLVGFDGARELPYDSSVVRYYDREHLQQIVGSGGASLAKSPEDFIAKVASYLRDQSQDASGRVAIRDAQCWRLDGKAGERIAATILEVMRKRQTGGI